MAYGLPVEGEDGPFLVDQVDTAATCDVTLSVADARRVLGASDQDVVVLVGPGGLAVGEVDRAALDDHADDVALLEVLRPVPSTVRPSVTVASVAEAGGGDPLVTTSDGRLLGRATLKAADGDDTGHDDHDDDEGHEGHDHAGHGHEPPLDMERYEQELTDVMKAVEERFGDGEPTAGELRAFLRDRLVDEGRSPEEADQLVDGLELGEPG